MRLRSIASIGIRRNSQFYTYHPPMFTMNDADKWLAHVQEGAVGRLEFFWKSGLSSIQITTSNPLPYLTAAAPYFYPLPKKEEQLECFQFYVKKPMFFSLGIQEIEKSWLETLQLTETEGSVQLIFQKDKKERWKALLLEQYEDYLKGIDTPSPYLPLRAIQRKVAQLSEKLNFAVAPISTFEERMKSHQYRFTIVGMVMGEKAIRDHILQTTLSTLNRYKGENEWGIIRNLPPQRLSKWQERNYLGVSCAYITEDELKPLLFCPELTKEKKQIVFSKTEKSPKKGIYPAFQFLPFGQKKQEPLLIDSLEQELNGALEKIGVIKDNGLSIIEVKEGPTLLKLEVQLPKGVRLSDLQKNASDWQTEIGKTDLTVSQGKFKGSGTLTIPRKVREVVYLRDLIDTESFKEFTNGSILPFAVGATEVGEPLYEDLIRVKHMLVAGSTGSGKSVWLLQFILTLLIWTPADQLMMYLIDPKRVEFSSFSSFKNVKVFTEVEEAKQLLASLIEEMENRYKQLSESKVRNISQYNQKNKEKPMPYIVTVIDEFSDFMLQDKEDGMVEENIIRLAQKARACGIHLILCTQRPSIDVVTGLIKANLPSRVVFRCSGKHDYSTVLDRKPSFNLLGKGDGVCLMEGKELVRFQGALIASNDEQMDKLITDYGKNQSGEAPNCLNLSEKQEGDIIGPLDELKRYVAFTGETRVTHLRKHMKMRMNDVKEMMQQLVEEGWLEAPKSRNTGYRLRLTEAERQEYLKKNQSDDI